MADAKKRKGWLSAKDRQDMPQSDFALPGRGKGPKGAGAGSYPVPDKAHARAALSRVSANGSASEKAEVRRKVAARFPDIKMADRPGHRYRDRRA